MSLLDATLEDTLLFKERFWNMNSPPDGWNDGNYIM